MNASGLLASSDDDAASRKTSLYDRLRETLRLTGYKSRSTSTDATRCPTIILSKSSPRNSDFSLDKAKDVLRKPSNEPSNVSLRSTHTEKSLIAKKRVIRMLLVIVVLFFVCWTPRFPCTFPLFLATLSHIRNMFSATSGGC